MLSQITKYIGNSVTLASATVASFSEDFRLWVVAIVGLVITYIGSANKRYKDSLEAQQKRLDLCKDCKANKIELRTCIVKPKQRPYNCPLDSIK